MKRIRNIHAVKISEDVAEMEFFYQVHNEGHTSLMVSSIAIDRKNLFKFRPELMKLFSKKQDFYIFEIDLPVIVKRQIIRRINQYLPKSIPAIVLSKNEYDAASSEGAMVQLLLNKPREPKEQQELKDSITSVWYPIIYGGLS